MNCSWRIWIRAKWHRKKLSGCWIGSLMRWDSMLRKSSKLSLASSRWLSSAIRQILPSSKWNLEQTNSQQSPRPTSSWQSASRPLSRKWMNSVRNLQRPPKSFLSHSSTSLDPTSTSVASSCRASVSNTRCWACTLEVRTIWKRSWIICLWARSSFSTFLSSSIGRSKKWRWPNKWLPSKNNFSTKNSSKWGKLWVTLKQQQWLQTLLQPLRLVKLRTIRWSSRQLRSGRKSSK